MKEFKMLGKAKNTMNVLARWVEGRIAKRKTQVSRRILRGFKKGLGVRFVLDSVQSEQRKLMPVLVEMFYKLEEESLTPEAFESVLRAKKVFLDASITRKIAKSKLSVMELLEEEIEHSERERKMSLLSEDAGRALVGGQCRSDAADPVRKLP